MLLVFAVPVPQRILSRITQLADRRLNPLVELDIKLDRANSVRMGTDELPPGGPSLRPDPLNNLAVTCGLTTLEIDQIECGIETDELKVRRISTALNVDWMNFV